MRCRHDHSKNYSICACTECESANNRTTLVIVHSYLLAVGFDHAGNHTEYRCWNCNRLAEPAYTHSNRMDSAEDEEFAVNCRGGCGVSCSVQMDLVIRKGLSGSHLG